MLHLDAVMLAYAAQHAWRVPGPVFAAACDCHAGSVATCDSITALRHFGSVLWLVVSGYPTAVDCMA